MIIETVLLVAVLCGAQMAAFATKRAGAQVQPTRFKVRIENISNPDGYAASNGTRWPFALSPGLYFVGAKPVTLFREGRKASTGLESQAEDGDRWV